jgi:hypothetical protein
MNFIFSTLIVILIILLFSIVAAWLDRFGRKRKEKFFDEIFDKVSDFITSHLSVSVEKCKTGPWYLVVYTMECNIPIWISHSNIRSVHPDPKNCKLIIKLFNGEDMVIDDVERYEFQAGNELFHYNM